MKIGVIGTGNIGGTLGKLWADQGHEIMFGMRDTQSAKVQTLLGPRAYVGRVAEATAFGEAVLLAVPGPAAQEAIQQGGNWSGKILIDATNRLVPTPPESMPSAAEDIARWAAGAKVVKAFNSAGVGIIARPQFGSQQADTFICGDDEAAKAVVARLAQEIGLGVVDCGPLTNAALVEALAKLWIQLAYPLGNGPDIAFKLLRR